MEKVNKVIEIINRMDIKDKLRLAICISQSEWAGLIYNTKENCDKFDNMLKELDKKYRTTLVNLNKIAMYLYNNILNELKIKI